MNDIYGMTAARRHTTPQSEKAEENQVRNHAGGYVFDISDMARAYRFLLIGSDGGTYYQDAAELTLENARVIKRLADSDDDRDALELVGLISYISDQGIAPKVQPAIFALAIAANGKNAAGRRAAKAAIPDVIRTGSHLLTYTRYVDLLGGWSRGKRGGLNSFYSKRTYDELAYQMVKYRQRDGWSQRDALRVAHPKTKDPVVASIFDWVTKGLHVNSDFNEIPPVITDFEFVQDIEEGDINAVLQVIERGTLSWEMLPDWALTHAKVWTALIDTRSLPLGALIRNLARLTNLGVIGPFGQGRTHEIVDRLTNPDMIKKARIHPIAILIAMKTYAKGQMRSGGTYSPVSNILSALDEAFYLAFGNVEPANKRTLIGLDISGSMGGNWDPSHTLTAREVGTAMAVVLKATEPWAEVYGFTAEGDGRTTWGRSIDTAFTPLHISKGERLDDVTNRVAALPMGNTDCSLPIREALKNDWEVDTFVIITDNESWAGPEHAHQSLAKYRKSKESRKNAKLIVVAVTPTELSVADPSDPMGQLDICGFGSDVPQLVTSFSKA